MSNFGSYVDVEKIAEDAVKDASIVIKFLEDNDFKFIKTIERSLSPVTILPCIHLYRLEIEDSVFGSLLNVGVNPDDTLSSVEFTNCSLYYNQSTSVTLRAINTLDALKLFMKSLGLIK